MVFERETTGKLMRESSFNRISLVSEPPSRCYQAVPLFLCAPLFRYMRVLISFLLAAILLNTSSCGREQEDEKPSSKRKPKPKPKPVVVKEKHDPSKEIEALTGAHTRLVWAEAAKPGDSDTFATIDGLV